MGIDHRRKILIIQYYLNEFPDKLKGYKNINLESLTDDELDDLKPQYNPGKKSWIEITFFAFWYHNYLFIMHVKFDTCQYPHCKVNHNLKISDFCKKSGHKSSAGICAMVGATLEPHAK